MRVLIAASNISTRMGGEAVLPFHIIREMRALGVDCLAVAHARVRKELSESEIWDPEKFHFIEDAFAEKALFRASKLAPPAIRDRVFMSAIAAVTGARIAKAARRISRNEKVDVIHQPTPVSPKFPSFLTRMPAPVVIGPMNGGMTFPPAFAKEYGQGSLWAVKAARMLSGAVNRLIPGKIEAAAILVANERTREALPSVIDPAKVELIVENGVDLALWNVESAGKPENPVFVFVGRLIWLKAVDLLIEAFAELPANARLLIIGDGPERARLTEIAGKSPASARIEFLGFRKQPEIRDIVSAATALVLPSLHECGGAVILEAFACRTAAIATDWGGPREYVTPETGYLISPDSKQGFIDGLAQAMTALAADRALATRMGEAAHEHVVANFSWAAKAKRMVSIYEAAIRNAARPVRRT